MYKKVNGKVIDIKNMELFEKAFEGMALGRLVASSVADTISEKSETINRCIKSYEDIYKSMPFPLYCIEEDIKYAVIAMYIKDINDIVDNMWVDKALYIQVEPNKALKFVGNTWGIVTIPNQYREDNTDIEIYSDEIGYDEFKWVLTKMMNKESLVDYYNKFMREFVDACNKEPMVLKWELGRMLDFGPVPDKLNLKENRLLDINTGSEFFLDIFSTGKRKLEESEIVISLIGANSELKKVNKYVKTFDFEVYEKKAQLGDITESARIAKLQKSNLDGAAAIFETLAGKGAIQDGIENVPYTGIIVGKDIIYQVGSQIYKCEAQKYIKAIEMARNGEIYGYERGYVYVQKKSLCSSGVEKNAIYAYNIKDNSLRLCKIYFS